MIFRKGLYHEQNGLHNKLFHGSLIVRRPCLALDDWALQLLTYPEYRIAILRVYSMTQIIITQVTNTTEHDAPLALYTVIGRLEIVWPNQSSIVTLIVRISIWISQLPFCMQCHQVNLKIIIVAQILGVVFYLPYTKIEILQLIFQCVRLQ